MTHSFETAAPTKRPDLRFEQVVSVHHEGDMTVMTFRDSDGVERRVAFLRDNDKFFLACFSRLYGELR